MKLQQGQVWKYEDRYIRIVTLEKLAVGFKLLKDLQSRDGTHQKMTKKKFCGLLKTAVLVLPEPSSSSRPRPD